MTNERVNWKQVKEYSTYISTALVKKYGLKEGETVSLFSQNSIWYPVVMFGCLRAGMCHSFFFSSLFSSHLSCGVNFGFWLVVIMVVVVVVVGVELTVFSRCESLRRITGL